MEEGDQKVQPEPNMNATPVTEQKAKGNSSVWIVVVIIVAVAVIAGVAYWYRQNQTASQTTSGAQQTEQFNTELNSLDTNDLEADFSGVDTDLQTL